MIMIIDSGSGSKRHSLQPVELSQRLQTAVQIVSIPPAPAMGARIIVSRASRSCGPDGWLALLLIKAGDVEINYPYGHLLHHPH